jgi:3-oxoacyl-[acyl-carrier-protein] synthase-3
MSSHVRAAITGLGSALPQKVMTNFDFAKFLDTSDEWITQRTGIKQRHVAGQGETSASLGTQAAKAALANAGVDAGQLDLIICATVSPEMIFPGSSCFIQTALGIKDTPAFDISAACSGFLYGITVASQFIQSGMYKRVMVVGADTLTKFCDFTDRGSCILFGDGAGAAILEATSEDGRGVLYNVLKADGAGWDFINLPGGGSRTPPTHASIDAKEHYVKMKGRDVYKFAVDKMQWLLGDCMEKCGLTSQTVDMVVPHQVNIRIIESAAKKFDLPMDKVYVNIDRYGNTSSASIPIALEEATRTGKIGKGSTIVMVAFGAGLTWAGSVVRL